MQSNPNIDPFEAFFNGGSGYIEVKKQIKAPGMSIEVLREKYATQHAIGVYGYMDVDSKIENQQKITVLKKKQ